MSEHDFHDEEVLEASYDRALMAWLLRYARLQWRTLLVCIVLLAVLVLVQLAQPQIIRVAIDQAMRPAGEEAAPEDSAALLAKLYPLVVLYGLTVVVVSGLQYAQSLLLRRTGQRIITRIRADTFAHLQTLSLSYYDSRPAGRIVTRVTNDVEALNEMYTSVLVNFFRDAFYIAGAVIILLRLDAMLALLSFAALPIVVATAMLFRHYSRTAWRDMRTRLARINATLAETFSGIRVIQAFGREAKGAEEFRATNDEFYGASLHVIRIFAIFGPALDLLTTSAVAIVIWVGGAQVLAGTLTFGTLYAFTAYLRMLFGPVNALAEKYNIMQAALAAAERLTELVNTAPEVADPAPERACALPPRRVTGTDEAAAPSSPDVPAVSFDDVWFAYQGDQWVLRGVSFDVMPGETVAFVGHTGAGKSTIMNLVPRLYDVQRGAVRVHGCDVRDLTQADLRQRVGIVMQDVFLFAGDVAANVHLGDPRISRAEVERAASAVGADTFIARLPDGFEEPVVERGLSLSAGQRQLISFARALAYDPDVLILDEATASVDSETEAALQKAIGAVSRARTTLIVAHRLATVRGADRIYVMHHGRIVEVGDHEGLLSRDGLYRKLWDLQFDDRPAAAATSPGA